MCMSAPPLKMNQMDVQEAISRAFKKNLSQLHFNNSQSFSAVDTDGNCAFFLQRTFDGEGRYEVNGQVKLWNSDHTFSAVYNIGATVVVYANNTVPEITFEGILTAKKL